MNRANIRTTDCVHWVEDKKARRSSGGIEIPMNGMLGRLKGNLNDASGLAGTPANQESRYALRC